VDNDYIELKAEITFQEFRDLPKAIQILKTAKQKNKRAFQQLFQYYLYANEIENAKLIADKFPTDNIMKRNIYEYEQNYNDALDIIQMERKSDEYDKELITHETFLLLKTEKYKEAENLAYKYLTKIDFKDPILYVNYILAQKKLGKNDIKNHKIQEKLIGNGEESIHRAAGYALIDDKDSALKQIAKAIEEDYSYKYRIKDWVIFEDYASDSKYKKLLNN
jgi:hypothetical protein